MKLHIRHLAVIGFLGLLASAAADLQGQGVWPPYEPTAPEVPYVGELTGDNVYIRSGPGNYFYTLGMLKLADKVRVEDVKWGWCAIQPTADVYGLVAKENVERAEGSQWGTVSAERARVYASSPTAARRWAVMATLNAGDKVQILAEDGGLYRIAVPSGARVYVSWDYVKRVDAGTSEPGGPVKVDLTKLAPDPEEAAFKELEAQLAEETKKPFLERDLKRFEEPYAQIADKAEAEYLKRMAKQRAEWIKRQIKMQENHRRAEALRKELESKLDEIDKKSLEARTRLHEASGTIERWATAEDFPGQIKFKLLDADGGILMLLSGKEDELSKFVGEMVKLKGRRSYRVEWDIYILDVESIEPLE